MTVPVLAQNTGILELLPADGSTVYKLPDYFSVNPGGASEIVFELDGKYLGKADGDGKIAAPDLAYGAHTIKASAVVPGGTVICEEASFTYEKSTLVTSHVQNFDALDGNTDNLSADFYMVDSSRGSFTLTKGASGETGDYALNITKKEGLPYIESKLFKNFGQGNTEIEFDIKFNSTEDTLRISSPSLWCEGIEVISGGKWIGTDVAITDKWTNIKITQDHLSQKVSFAVDGNTLISNAPFAGSMNNSVLRLTCSTPDSAAVKGGFSIDNFKAECLLPDKLVNKSVYVSENGEHPLGEDTPVNPEKISIYLQKGLKNPSVGNVSLTASYGASVPLSTVSYNAETKVLDLGLPSALTAGRNYVLTLDKTLKLSDNTALGNNYEIRFSTAKASLETEAYFKLNNYALTTASQIDYGDTVSVDITSKNITEGTLTVTYFLTLRKDTALCAMKAVTLTLGGGETKNVTLTLPEIEDYYGEYEVYLFNCTDFADISAVEDFVQLK